MPVDPVSLGIAFAGFVKDNYKKVKPIDGAKRADLLNEICPKFPEYESYFIEFFSDNEVFDIFKKLQKGQDFEKLVLRFEEYCERKNLSINRF